MSKLEELKQEAAELGIQFSANIGEAKLAAKIEEYYTSQETSGVEIQEEPVEVKEKSEEKSAVKGKSKAERYKEMEDKARETSIITVIDNDQRVNNQTTVATVSCGNMSFDLGTAHIPLNIPVEVRQGHIDALKDIKIPQHTKDPKTGLSKMVRRPRYTISYERIEK